MLNFPSTPLNTPTFRVPLALIDHRKALPHARTALPSAEKQDAGRTPEDAENASATNAKTFAKTQTVTDTARQKVHKMSRQWAEKDRWGPNMPFEELLARNIALVGKSIALVKMQITVKPDQMPELENAVLWGLQAANAGFDPSRGYKWSTYAVQAMINEGKKSIDFANDINYRAAKRGSIPKFETPVSLDYEYTNNKTTITFEETLADTSASEQFEEAENNIAVSEAIQKIVTLVKNEMRSNDRSRKITESQKVYDYDDTIEWSAYLWVNYRVTCNDKPLEFWGKKLGLNKSQSRHFLEKFERALKVVVAKHNLTSDDLL